MNLGAFSISLAVEDISASRAFYEKLGFAEFGGDQEQNWLTMKNGTMIIGLFQGMFEGNLLTFNPGCHIEYLRRAGTCRRRLGRLSRHVFPNFTNVVIRSA